MKKILISIFAFAFIALAAMGPPISAQAAGFHDVLDVGQSHTQIAADPYNGDISNIMAIALIDDRSLLNPAEPEKAAIGAVSHGSTAIMAAKALVMKGGGFLGTSTIWKPIVVGDGGSAFIEGWGGTGGGGGGGFADPCNGDIGTTGI